MNIWFVFQIFQDAKRRVQFSRVWYNSLELSMEQGREHSILGFNTHSLKTPPTALHVDIFPCLMHQTLPLHQSQASPIGKRRLSKEAGFKLHSKSEMHVNAMYAWNQCKKATEMNTSMLNSLNMNWRKKVEEDQHYVKTIANVLLLTATQIIVQRGHRESSDSE